MMIENHIDVEAAVREGLTVVRCHKCGCPLLVCDHDKLYLYGSKGPVSYDKVRVTCKCGTSRTWRPAKAA